MESTNILRNRLEISFCWRMDFEFVLFLFATTYSIYFWTWKTKMLTLLRGNQGVAGSTGLSQPSGSISAVGTSCYLCQ